MAYAFLKLAFAALYTSKYEKSIDITVSLNNVEETITCLVDTGCMACDPFDSKPVIIVKKNSFGLTRELGDLMNYPDIEVKKRIRVIPIKTLGEEKILLGIRSDYIKLKNSTTKQKDIVIALDEEGGSFSGYIALAPLLITE